MSIRVTCECGHWFVVRAELAGKKGRCACGRTVHIPGADGGNGHATHTAHHHVPVPAAPDAVPAAPPPPPQTVPEPPDAHLSPPPQLRSGARVARPLMPRHLPTPIAVPDDGAPPLLEVPDPAPVMRPPPLASPGRRAGWRWVLVACGLGVVALAFLGWMLDVPMRWFKSPDQPPAAHASPAATRPQVSTAAGPTGDAAVTPAPPPPPNPRDRRPPTVPLRTAVAGPSRFGGVVGEVQRFTGHTAAARGVGVSADLARLISVGDDKALRRWDAQTGTGAGTADVGATPTVMAVSADGLTVAVGAADGSVRIWTLGPGAPGAPAHTIPAHGATVTALALSADGSRLATASEDQLVKIWDTATARPQGEVRSSSGSARALALSGDGYDLAVAGDEPAPGSAEKAIRVFQAGAGLKQYALIASGHTSAIRAIAFSPDAKQVATGGGKLDRATGRGVDCAVRLWHLGTRTKLAEFAGHDDVVRAVAFSARGARILSASDDKSLRLWDTQTGDEMKRFDGHSDAVLALAASLDGKYAATASADRTVRLWRLPD